MMNAIKEEGGFKAAELITSFTKQIPQGNLFIPGFVNTLQDGASVDMHTLKPETGGLSKEAFSEFKKGKCIRTNDPFHSFFIYGREGEEIMENTFNNRNTFGTNSVFGYLHKKGGVLLIMDLQLYFGFTFAHYVEEQKKVHYRKSTAYTFMMKDVKGNTAKTIYHIYAKKKGYNPVLNTLEGPLTNAGALQKFVVNGIPVFKIDMQLAFTVLENDILNNKARNLINFSLPLYLKQTIKKLTGRR
jgi:aminoglycoside 3-N-acetyltransferase